MNLARWASSGLQIPMFPLRCCDALPVPLGRYVFLVLFQALEFLGTTVGALNIDNEVVTRDLYLKAQCIKRYKWSHLIYFSPLRQAVRNIGHVRAIFGAV